MELRFNFFNNYINRWWWRTEVVLSSGATGGSGGGGGGRYSPGTGQQEVQETHRQ
jgi:hypothetical protein